MYIFFPLVTGLMKPPTIKPFSFSGDLHLGHRTAVICTVTTGDPNFNFEWYKDEVLLQENDKISIKSVDEFTSILTLKRLDSDSNGNYTCRASNSAGLDQKSELLTMKGKFYDVAIFFSVKVSIND